MTETPDPNANYVVLTEEPNLPRAHWVAGALQGEGIPTFVDEDNLADEFAISQKVMGLLRVRVLVPADRLDEARTVFLGLSQPIPLIDEDDEAETAELEEESRTRSVNAVVAILLPLLLLAVIAALVVLARSSGHEEDRDVWPPHEPVPPWRAPHRR